MNYLNLNTKIMNKENYKEKLFELLDCIDADFTGSNGDDYTWGFALEEGFKSNLEYCIHEASNKHNSLEDIVKSVINDAKGSWRDYYDNTNTVIINMDNQLVVSVAVSHN